MMTAEQLKASIFQLAMQGKLVEQRPEEGTGEGLYKQIQEEKVKLIKEGKIKKQKTLPEITEDEIPFEIPLSWKWVRLQNVLTNILVPQRDKPKSFNGDIPWCRIEDIEGKYLNGTKSNQFVSSQTVSQMNLKVNPKGTVISANSASVGEAAICTVECVTNQTFVGLVCSSGLYNEYLYYFLVGIKSKIRQMGSGTTILYVSQEKYKHLPIPLPPLAEQKRIVTKIEELMPFVEQYAVASSKLDTLNTSFPDMMKKSILQEAVQGKLVTQDPNDEPASELLKRIAKEKERLVKEGKIKKQKALPKITEDEIPFEIPESWEWCYINDIAFVTKLAGFEYTKNIAPNLTGNGIPLFKGKNIQNGRLIEDFESFIPEVVSNEMPRSQLTKKCLLTPYVGTIGNIAIFNGEYKAHLGSNVGKIEIHNSDNILIMEEYVLYYLRSPEGYRQLTKYKKATAQESISIDAIRNAIIAVPPIEEQHRIVQVITGLIDTADAIRKESR